MSAQQPRRGGLTPNVPALAGATVITILAALAWFPMVAGLSSLTDSDAAGNALSQAYTAIAMGFLWLLLAVLTLIAWVKGDMPLPLALAAVVFIPIACVGSFIALGLLSEPYKPPHLWPIVLPAAAPPLIVVFAFWALAPALRRSIPAPLAGGMVFGTIFILCAALYPMEQVRDAVHEKEAEAQRRYDEAYAALRPDAPLWEWVRFLDTRNESLRADILERMSKLPRRQQEAELMLDRGDFPLGILRSLDLDPTPSVCDKTRTLLREQASALMPEKPGVRKYSEVAVKVDAALSAFRWLIGYGCNSDAELDAWEKMATSYTDTNYDVHELRDLHDPKLLGKTLREAPERFSMLTPQSHLSAWLKFSEQPEFHDQALAGARMLSHRTQDAVEILSGDEFAGYPVMENLTTLDLDATPALCAAARKHVQIRFGKIYRPKPDEPRAYRDFLLRLGDEVWLDDLIWLAGRGCDVEPELKSVEDLIGAYEESRARGEILARLADAHKKP